MRNVVTTILVASAAVMALTSVADAQTKRHRVKAYDLSSLQDAPLTVNRRSWLDSGPVSPVGKGPSYIAATTEFSRDQQQIINPDRFGNDVLQGQPYVPGRTVSVVEFSTLPTGGVVADAGIGYQNYYLNPAPSLPASGARPIPEYAEQ